MSLKTHFNAVFYVIEALCELVGLVEMCIWRTSFEFCCCKHRWMVGSGSPLHCIDCTELINKIKQEKLVFFFSLYIFSCKQHNSSIEGQNLETSANVVLSSVFHTSLCEDFKFCAGVLRPFYVMERYSASDFSRNDCRCVKAVFSFWFFLFEDYFTWIEK